MKKYKLVCYIKINSDNYTAGTLEEIINEKINSEMLFPKNIYKIEEAINETVQIKDA